MSDSITSAIDRLTDAVIAHTAELARQFDLQQPLRDATTKQLNTTADLMMAQAKELGI